MSLCPYCLNESCSNEVHQLSQDLIKTAGGLKSEHMNPGGMDLEFNDDKIGTITINRECDTCDYYVIRDTIEKRLK